MSIKKDYHTKVSYGEEISNTIWDQIANSVSNFFSPPLTVLYGVLISTPFLDIGSPWLWSALFLFFFVVPPTIYVFFLLRSGYISDFHINNRDKRLKPLIIIILNTVVSLGLYHVIGGPKYLIVLAACCLITLVMMFSVTLFWKISGHCTAAGGLAVIALSLLNELVLPFTILLPVIAWSRVRLERHTVSQTLVGLLLGILVFGTTLYFTNLI